MIEDRPGALALLVIVLVVLVVVLTCREEER